MTQEEKAKAYDEALEKAQKATRAGSDVAMDIVQYIFPELTKSEDEMIRKALIDLIGVVDETYLDFYLRMPEPRKKMIAYLEKQKERKSAEVDEYEIIKKHITKDSLSSEVNKRLKECGWYVTEKPAEWSEEDERMRQTAIEACKTVAEDYENSNARFYKCKDWLEYRLEFLRPQSKQEWSEKDYNAILIAIDWLQYYRDTFVSTEGAKDEITACVDRLKSLRTQPKREWSEEDKDRIEDILLIIKHATNIPYGGGRLTIDKEYKDELSKFLKSFVPNAEN